MTPQHWFVYALGGGLGHLTRACALARAALPEARIRILTNSPYAASVARAMPELDLLVLDAGMGLQRNRAEIVRRIASSEPDCLIVDTFPRGLGGELVNVLSAFCGLNIFVQRDLNPQYSAIYNLDVFVANSYDLIFAPGDTVHDSLGPFPKTVTTAPWLIRSPHELPDRDRARRLLGLHDDGPCIVLCAAGYREELAWYGEVAAQLFRSARGCNVRCIAPLRPEGCPPECWVDYWPAMDLYAGADVVIGGAGYNTICESVACGVPLVAKPWPRKYDRQHLRARRAADHACVRIVDEPERAVAAALELLGTRGGCERPLRFENGAAQAVARIRQRAAEAP